MSVPQWIGRRFFESRQFYAIIALAIGIVNFITIQYQLLLRNVPEFAGIFTNIAAFGVVSVIIVIIITMMGGHYFYRRFQLPIDHMVNVQANPFAQASIKKHVTDLYFEEALLESMGKLTPELKRRIEATRAELESMLRDR